MTVRVAGSDVTLDLAGASTTGPVDEPVPAARRTSCPTRTSPCSCSRSGSTASCFELQHPNFVTGIVGALALILAFVGAGSLPLQLAGVLLIGLSAVLLLLEATVTSHGLLAVGAVIAFVLGAATLYTEPGDPDAAGRDRLVADRRDPRGGRGSAWASSSHAPRSSRGGCLRWPSGRAGQRWRTRRAWRPAPGRRAWCGRPWRRSGRSSQRARSGAPSRPVAAPWSAGRACAWSGATGSRSSWNPSTTRHRREHPHWTSRRAWHHAHEVRQPTAGRSAPQEVVTVNVQDLAPILSAVVARRRRRAAHLPERARRERVRPTRRSSGSAGPGPIS